MSGGKAAGEPSAPGAPRALLSGARGLIGQRPAPHLTPGRLPSIRSRDLTLGGVKKVPITSNPRLLGYSGCACRACRAPGVVWGPVTLVPRLLPADLGGACPALTSRCRNPAFDLVLRDGWRGEHSNLCKSNLKVFVYFCVCGHRQEAQESCQAHVLPALGRRLHVPRVGVRASGLEGGGFQAWPWRRGVLSLVFMAADVKSSPEVGSGAMASRKQPCFF